MRMRGTVALHDSGMVFESTDGRAFPLGMVAELVWCTMCGRVDEFGALRINMRARRPDLRCGTCWTSWGAEHLAPIVWWSDARERLLEMRTVIAEPAPGSVVTVPAGFWDGW